MATAWELKQQEAAKKAQERQLVRGVTGTAAQWGVKENLKQAIARGGGAGTAASQIKSAGTFATFINLVGALSIGAWQYLSGKKELKKKERLTRNQENAIRGIDDLLVEIDEVGRIVVQEHGIDPTTADFEKVLYDNLFKTIGYTGNCNMIARVPGTTGENRPIWFKVTGNGRVFTPINMAAVPPNVGAHWHTNCKNLKDGWASIYQDLLIQQGRVRELETFQQARKKGVLTLRIVFGLVFAILLFLVVRYGAKIR